MYFILMYAKYARFMACPVLITQHKNRGEKYTSFFSTRLDSRHMQIGRKCDECDERSLWGSDHTRHTSYYAVVIEIYQAFRSSLSSSSSLAYNAVTDLAKTKAETRRRHRDIKRDRERASERERDKPGAVCARASKTPTPTPTTTPTATFANEILLCAKSNNL